MYSILNNFQEDVFPFFFFKASQISERVCVLEQGERRSVSLSDKLLFAFSSVELHRVFFKDFLYWKLHEGGLTH